MIVTWVPGYIDVSVKMKQHIVEIYILPVGEVLQKNNVYKSP